MSNCIRTNNKKFKLNTLTSLKQDDCYNTVAEKISSVVIKAKTQYRIFFADQGAEAACSGVIAVFRVDRWEYSDM